MDETKVARLARQVARLRKETQTLAQEGASFPAIWRNARRVEACLRMMEMNLGQSLVKSEQ